MSNIFTCTGDKHNDLWLVNGSPVFAIFPAGIIENITADVPIHLKVGNSAFGARHIEARHYRWLTKQGFATAHELVHFKLAQPGIVYCTEAENKLKIMMRLRPEAIMVMELLHKPATHLSVTTLYYHQGSLDGDVLGRYPGWR